MSKTAWFLTLRRNDIVVMWITAGSIWGPALAGLSKREWARHCVTCRNIRPTSPIPSGDAFYSKFKTFLRKVAARTIPSLNRAIRSFIPQPQSSRMCQLFQACRLCFNMIGIRFSKRRVTDSGLVPLGILKFVSP